MPAPRRATGVIDACPAVGAGTDVTPGGSLTTMKIRPCDQPRLAEPCAPETDVTRGQRSTTRRQYPVQCGCLTTRHADMGLTHE